jgi:hypothetical protein
LNGLVGDLERDDVHFEGMTKGDRSFHGGDVLVVGLLILLYYSMIYGIKSICVALQP